MRPRGPLRPEDFKSSQSKLLQQAVQLGAYVSRQQQASRQQAGGHGWLVVQQSLEQEGADCTAALSDSLRASPHLQQVLLPDQDQDQDQEDGEPKKEEWEEGESDKGQRCTPAGTEAASHLPQDQLVAGAVGLAAVVAQLLAAARQQAAPLQPATVAEIHGHIGVLAREVAAGYEALAQVGHCLDEQAARHAAAAAAGAKAQPGGQAGAALAAAVEGVCREHPLAAAGLKLHLVEEARQMEAVFLGRRRQRAAAYSAFMQGGTVEAGASAIETLDSPADKASCGSAGSWVSSAGSTGAGSGGDEGMHKDGDAVPPEPGSNEEGGGSSSCSGSMGDSLAELSGEGGGLSGLGMGECSTGAAFPAPRAPRLAGWSKEERAAFGRIQRDCVEECGPTAGQAAVVEAMRRRLPAKSTAQLGEYWRWHKEASCLRTNLAQLHAGWEVERQAFLVAAGAMLEESFVKALQAAEGVAVELEREIRALQRAQAMGERQDEQEVAAAQRAQQRIDELAEAAAQREAQQAQREAYRARMRELLGQYREVRNAKHAEAQALAEAEKARAQQKVALEAVANQKRVDYRRRQAGERARAQEAAAREREQEAQRRAVALDRLRAKVAPTVERDPQRVVAPTASTKASKGPRQGRAFHNMFGFTTDDILKDQRFKLFEALRKLNLHSCDYAREALARARPAKPIRMENLTTLQMLGLG